MSQQLLDLANVIREKFKGQQHRPVPEQLALGMCKDIDNNAEVGLFDAGCVLAITLIAKGHNPAKINVIERKGELCYYEFAKETASKLGFNHIVPSMNNIKNLDRKFDVIIGNPPYQSGVKNSGNTLWDKFVAQSIEMLNDGGIMSFITPPRWRQPEDALSYIYRDYQLVSLQINGIDQGKKVFKATTQFDVYTIQKSAPYKDTLIEFADGVTGEFDVTQMPFIPNSRIDFWLKAFNSTDDKLQALWTYSHDPRAKHVFNENDKPESAIHPLTHTFTKKGVTYRYSTKAHSHQNVPKVIFGDSGDLSPIYDDGVYGCTQHSIFIPVIDQNQGKKIIEFLTSNKEIIESIKFSQRQFGPKPINYIPVSFL